MLESIFYPQSDILYQYFNHAEDPQLIFDTKAKLLNANKTFTHYIGLNEPDKLLNLSLFDDFQLSTRQVQTMKEHTYAEINMVLHLDIFSKHNHLNLSNRNIIEFRLIMSRYNDFYYIRCLKKNKYSQTHKMLEDEQLSLVMNSTDIVTWEWNLVNNSIHFSDNFYQWFDMNLHYLEHNANSIFSLIHPEDVERARLELYNFIHQVSSTLLVEFRFRRNNKDYILLRSSACLIVDQTDTPTRLSGLSINITAQVEDSIDIQQERSAMNNLFRSKTTGFLLGKILLNEDHQPSDFEAIYTNPAFKHFTGLELKSIIGKPLYSLIPDLDSHWLRQFSDVALNGDTLHFTHYVPKLKKHFDVIAYQSDYGYFAAIFSDITNVVHKENAAAQADKMKSVGQLAGGIAHDFNNHLQIIRGYSEILNEKLQALDNPTLQFYTKQIQLSVKHSSNMIKQLLAFSKDDRYTGKPLDFHLLLHQTKNILQYTMNPSITIQMLLEATHYKIIGDESLLQNTIINICLNAKDALPKGGLIFIMTSNIEFKENTFIGLNQLTSGNYIRTTIRDNGKGIRPEDLEHIFEPFYTTKYNKGIGMGLAASYGTIQNHNGAIDVSSQAGEWTQVEFYLPVSSKSVKYHVQPMSEISTPFVPYYILIVDDEPIITLIIEQFLSKLGHTVKVYNSPSALLADTESIKKADLFLLDVIMPEMNGFDLLEALLTYRPDVFSIFLSGYYKITDVKDHLHRHVLDYIEKPVNLTELNEKIQRLMENPNYRKVQNV